MRLAPLLPLSGAEPRYNPIEWNSKEADREAHNCYAYFLQDYYKRRANNNDNYPQPGAYALRRRALYSDVIDSKNGIPLLQAMPARTPFHCAAVQQAVLADNSGVYKAQRMERCAATHYKGFLAVDSNAKDSDYHFWMQNADGKWSHKPGKLPVTNRDSSGKPILDPLQSDRGRYDITCGYFCVPANQYWTTSSRTQPAD